MVLIFSCIKELALLEPLVDTVDEKQIITNPTKIFEIDILTAKKEEVVAFKSNFEIIVTHTEICHALVAYFDIDFSLGHKTISFSTGPQSEHTHWKQTVFYFEEDLAITEGDKIICQIDVIPNKKKYKGTRYYFKNFT